MLRHERSRQVASRADDSLGDGALTLVHHNKDGERRRRAEKHPPSGREHAHLTTTTMPTPPGGRRRANAGSGGEGVLGGELLAGAALREYYGFARPAELGGELTLRFVVEHPGEHLALARCHRLACRDYGIELLAGNHDPQRVSIGAGRRELLAERSIELALAGFAYAGRWHGVLKQLQRRFGARLVVVQRAGTGEELVLARAGRVQRFERLVAGAEAGEGAERPPRGLPGADRLQQAEPCLLRDVGALAAARQAQGGDDCADQRLVAAQQLLQRGMVVVLGCQQQRTLVYRGRASGTGSRHARAGSARH